MSRYLLTLALVLTSLGGFALAEPPQSPVTPGALRIGPTGWQRFRDYYTQQDAIFDGQHAKAIGEARDFAVRGPTREGHWQLWLLDHQ
jgi:hypothetical protein